MKKLIVISAASLFLNCHSKINSSKNRVIKNLADIETHSSVNFSAIILDTLVFDADDQNDILENKFRKGQKELVFYKRFIKPKKVNQIQALEDAHTKTQIRYLGKLNDLENGNSYDVITKFKTIGIGLMSSPRGISHVAFVDKNDAIIIYDMVQPDYLPRYIENNTLFFETESTKIAIQISGGLSSLLCPAVIGCH